MNINLSEILLILIVALVVIKPERMPEVAFKLGKWAKQLRGGMNKLKSELDGTLTQLNEEVSLKALPDKTEKLNEPR